MPSKNPEMKPSRQVARVLKDMKDENGQIPRVANIAAAFLKMAGGEEAFAKMLYDQFTADKVTPMTKTRIVQFVLDSLRFSESRAGAPLSDIDLLTEEDIQKKAIDLLQKAAASAKEEDGEED